MPKREEFGILVNSEWTLWPCETLYIIPKIFYIAAKRSLMENKL
jgi:hypothetical protein